MEKMAPQIFEIKGQRITLREAEANDAPNLLTFLSLISEETPFTLNYPGQILNCEKLAVRLGGEKTSNCNMRIIALDGEQIVGQIGMWRIHAEHPWLTHKAEFAMMVVKKWWGSGLAKVLITKMEAFAKTSKVSRIEATVNCLNERGIALYKKNGYAIEGTAIAYIIIDGKSHNCHYIAKLI